MKGIPDLPTEFPVQATDGVPADASADIPAAFASDSEWQGKSSIIVPVQKSTQTDAEIHEASHNKPANDLGTGYPVGAWLRPDSRDDPPELVAVKNTTALVLRPATDTS